VTVLGVDGAPGGWVWVALDDGAVSGAGFAERLAALPEASVIGIDIPLGFPTPGDRRPAEVAARARLGRRASSVFSVPPREVLEAPDYAAARATAERLTGRSVSAQAYALRASVLEAADAERAGLPLIEVHPEVVFASLVGGTLPPKKTWDGHAARRKALAGQGILLEPSPGPTGPSRPDDVLDAAACAWVALRHAGGQAEPLAEPTHHEDRAIWV
jgi:predicted RNase H-like nuclease